ncbi:MAG: RIP metalloprotease RseP [Lachnospiraceae bacterium]|nr:RIP metalloprotease RseP [Lachnospiraceae bacterium]
MSVTTIIWFVFVFCIIVVSHEFGHMIIAKRAGIQVDEFSIGMGPKIFGFHRNGTYYVLRWLPLGGACIFGGMSEEDLLDQVKPQSGEDEEEILTGESDELPKRKTYKFRDAPVWSRISSVLAGPMFNFILAYLIALVIVWAYGSDKPVVKELMDGYPAKEAGLMPGDEIIKINGNTIHVGREIYVDMVINKNGKPVEVTYLRNGEEHTTVIVPKYYEEEGRYLMGLTDYMEYVDCRNASVFKYSLYEVRYGLVATVKCLGMLISGNGSKDDLAGPIGMAKIIGDVEEVSKPYGFLTTLLNMFNIAMLLSINLGVMNLLPIPALDGGRLVFLLIEAIRGKPVPEEKEGIVQLAGFVLLFALMIFVMFNDIMRFF